MRSIDLIVIHCSASPNGRSLFSLPGTRNRVTPVQVIDGWHKDRGFHRDDYWRQRWNPSLEAIGYHFVIYTNGCPATGRHLGEVGAHALGHNATSIGVCLVGTDKFTADQWATLKATVQDLQKQFPRARVAGHRDLPNVHKLCPGFDVDTWLRGGMVPLADHLLEAQ